MKISEGIVIGNLTIESLFYGLPKKRKTNLSSGDYKHRFANCTCVCGNECVKLCSTLGQASSTISCGCIDGRGKGSWGNGRKQPKLNHSKYFPQQYLTYLKKKAIQRDLLFNITLGHLDRLYLKQNGLCYYSGRKLILPSLEKAFTESWSEWNVSVDRLNSNIGYKPRNIVLCTSESNLAKQSLSKNDFIQLCKEIAYKHS